jgi:hypothetical protein
MRKQLPFDYDYNGLDTNMENINPSIRDEIKTVLITLSKENCLAIHNVYREIEIGEKLSEISIQINQTINDLGGSVFIKLGSRSPKDSFIGNVLKGFCCHNDKEVFDLLFDSERIMEDSYRYYMNDGGYLVLREWKDIKKYEEFRCFVSDRKLEAISQYEYFNYFPKIVENKITIQNIILAKFQQIKDYIPSDCILDIWVKNYKEAVVIELNPLGIDTDPCLFSWNEWNTGSFEFRINTEPTKQEKRNQEYIDYAENIQ